MDIVQKFGHLKRDPKTGRRTSSAQAEEELALKQRAFNYLLGNFGRPDNDHPDRRTSGASNMASMVHAAQQNTRVERDTTPSMPRDSRNESHVNDTASREGSSSDIDDDSGRGAISPTNRDGLSPTNTGPTYRETIPPSYNTVDETTYSRDNAVTETTTTEYVPGAHGIIRPI